MKPTERGDRLKAEAALHRYEGMVRAISISLLHCARWTRILDEDDLRAEGRVAVLDALRTYQGYGIPEGAWVATRVRHRIIDAIRRLSRAGVTREDDRDDEREPPRLISVDTVNEQELPLAPDTFGREERAAHRRTQYQWLRNALATLSPRQREAFELSLYEGLSLREIGARMGITEARACQLQKLAVSHLQRVATQEPTE